MRPVRSTLGKQILLHHHYFSPNPEQRHLPGRFSFFPARGQPAKHAAGTETCRRQQSAAFQGHFIPFRNQLDFPSSPGSPSSASRLFHHKFHFCNEKSGPSEAMLFLLCGGNGSRQPAKNKQRLGIRIRQGRKFRRLLLAAFPRQSMQGVERKLVPTDLVRTASFPAVLRLHGQQMSLHPFQAHPGAISEHQSFSPVSFPTVRAKVSPCGRTTAASGPSFPGAWPNGLSPQERK